MENKANHIQQFQTGDIVKYKDLELEFEVVGFAYEEVKYDSGEDDVVIIDIQYWYTIYNKEQSAIAEASNEDLKLVSNRNENIIKEKEQLEEQVEKKPKSKPKAKPKGESKAKPKEESKVKKEKKEDIEKIMTKKKFSKEDADFLLDEYISLMSIHETISNLSPDDVEYKNMANEIMYVLQERGVE